MIQALSFIRVEMEERKQQLLYTLQLFLFKTVILLHQGRLVVIEVAFIRMAISQEQISNTQDKFILLEQLFAKQYHENLLLPMPLLR